MNKLLVDFLSGKVAIQVKTANDMKVFVDWLNKHDIYDMIVSNRNYYKDYAKISFWKDLAKQELSKNHKWIHPSYLCIYFGYMGDRLYWHYEHKEVAQDFNSIVGVSAL